LCFFFFFKDAARHFFFFFKAVAPVFLFLFRLSLSFFSQVPSHL
jgi:hypothetical protein